MTALPVLTAARLSSARACPRRHALEFVEGLRPRADAGPLGADALLRRGLAAWWSAPSDRLERALDALVVEADPFDLVRAVAVVAAYDARWGNEPLEVLATDVEYAAPLVSPHTGRPSRTWQVGGRLDAVVRDATGAIFVVVHRLKSEALPPDAPAWRQLQLDARVAVDLLGARAAGFAAVGCISDVIVRPRLRPLKATPEELRRYTKTGALYAHQRAADETPAEFRERLVGDLAGSPDESFVRGLVLRTAAETAAAEQDLWEAGRVIRTAERTGHAPRNPDACVRQSRVCPFFDACSGAASFDDPTRFERRAVRAANDDVTA